MTSGKIESAKAEFKKVFSEDFWFLIPEYQRSYVWETDNISELLEDLFYAFENKPENDYFLGSLVLKRTDNKEFPEYEVLDGQQRLTTFFIMMAVLRDLIDDSKNKTTIHSKIYQEKDELEGIPERTRITYKIRDNVDEFIKKYIIEYNGTSQEEDLIRIKNENNISLSHMANAILVMREILKHKADLPKFVGYIFSKALFIYVSTSNTEDAFRMFTILNDRGIPLTNADILKSQNIGVLSNEREIKKYAELWEDIEGKHSDGFDRFLQFIRSILIKEKARANLLEEFTEKIYKVGIIEKGKDSFELIRQYNEIYEKLIDLQDDNLSNKFKNLISIMKIGLRSEDWIPPLLHYFKKFNYHRLEEFLTLLEYKFAGDWICGVTPTIRLDAMNNILKKIDAVKDADDIFNDKDVFKVDIIELRNAINGNVYKKQFSKHLLLKLEYLMCDDTVHLSGYRYITVEHVLPQNPKADSQWCRDFSDEAREGWTNKLANLVLISKKKNSSLSNSDFKEKKEKYLQSRMDAFKANKIFIEQNDVWTVDILKNRQDEIVNIIVNNRYK
ncbi:hypothetical protein TPDSL_34610 [Terrisporobacter petrolearius]|uniref:DUF262 domain-containing protein n=1 Tax=Terrisporobacter petrolearius TaxID=1460447 RepID=UPI003369A074